MQPSLPEREMFAALKKIKVNNMTFSFMFVSSLQLGELGQPRHHPNEVQQVQLGLLPCLAPGA